MIDPEQLLKRLIAIPSQSREEDKAADLMESVLLEAGIDAHRQYNNTWALTRHYDPERPTLMLNSHIDTVRATDSWSRNPYTPDVTDGRLYGLGSNDAGASAVSLMAVFAELYETELPYNLLLAITAEEEVMGEHGMRAFIPYMEERGIRIDMALIGEPTGLQPAVAERGLLVLDAVTHGVSGHAARSEGVNAIYKAMADIETLRSFSFPKTSKVLGPVKISVTQIQAGTQHNVVPDTCRWVVDVRTTDAYNNQQVAEMLNAVVESELTPRSTRVWASVIPEDHPLVRAAIAMGGKPFVSPTTSDMALLHDIPSLKMGPGQSCRSHTADEFILIEELRQALPAYRMLLNNLAALY